MLGFVQNWFAAKANPIGVDFGTDCLRMAQVQSHNGEPRLLAAASADVPTSIRNDPEARLGFFAETVPDLLVSGNFRGKQAILALAAASTSVRHMRLPRMDDAKTNRAILAQMSSQISSQVSYQTRGNLSFDSDNTIVRHLIAGEVDENQQIQRELIVMAADRDAVERLLAAAGKARLDIVGMNVEPRAIVDCFAHVYRRKSDAEATNCFVDMGCRGTRAVIARGGEILFARSIPIGGDHFSAAVAHGLKVSHDEARLLRLKACHAEAPLDDQRAKRNLCEAPLNLSITTFVAERHVLERIAAAHAESERQHHEVEAACREPLNRLVEQLFDCRSYFESTFPGPPVDRLLFIGGEARNRSLCQFIARELGLAAQIGDPLVRMGRLSDVGFQSGIDRRLPQPAWSVAIGLSLGPASPPKQHDPSILNEQHRTL